MSEKFTPGPWHIDDRGSHGIEVGTYFRANPTMFNSLAEEIDTQANARLIAAAPDMYEALKEIARADTIAHSTGKYSLVVESCAESARAVIAKADGTP